MRKSTIAIAAFAFLSLPAASRAQMIGSYDNFDCFNDTGKTAEGFEIDVEDVSPSDITRAFPSNFSATPWVIRYGAATITSYDFTVATPDAPHSYDAGHKGVLVTWAATLQGGVWKAAYGNQPFGAGSVAGDGTPFVPNPTLTNGESCWYYGQGAAYPTSGCDHFGISFGGGVTPGKMTYHWKIPNAKNTALVNAGLEASIPPSPVLNVIPPVKPAAPPVVVAVARAPADAKRDPKRPQAGEAQFGDAYWLRTTTLYSPAGALLDNLQKANVANAKVPKTVAWTLLQRAPGIGPNAGMPEREAAENDNVGGKNVQVTKQYEYFKFSGAYDSETHQALCDMFYANQADVLAAGGNTVQVSCQNAAGNDAPYTKQYWTLDPGPMVALHATKGNLGSYLGAHINAYNVK